MDIFEIGAMIKAAREEKGISQVELAAEMGIGRSKLSELESGTIYDMGLRKVLAVADRLDLELVGRPRSSSYTLEDAQRDNAMGIR